LTSTWTWMSPPLQTTAPRPLIYPHPTPLLPPPRAHNNPKPNPSIQPYHSSSHRHQQRTRRAAAARAMSRSNLRARRTRRRFGRDGRLRAESSRASGSGGIGRRSRADGGGVEEEAKESKEYNAHFFLDARCNGVYPSFLLAGLSALHLLHYGFCF
jgi:hypothetical protein